jgi:protein SCO1
MMVFLYALLLNKILLKLSLQFFFETLIMCFIKIITVNKKALLALALAIMLPMAGYLFVKILSKDAAPMPRKYFYDSVGTTERRGKIMPDTIWHQVSNLKFTNQLGKKVSLDDLKGKIIVVDFFFTSCPTICPGLARNMKRLQDSYKQNDNIVQFLSISIDPVRDSVPRLRAFADRYNANHDSWWFVTGDKKEIYDFAIKEMKANVADVGADTAFPHTENFFLLDTNRVVRGWYNGFDTVKLAKLASDIPTVMLERNRKSPSIFREFIPILPVIFVGIGILMLVMALLNKNRKQKLPY